MTIIGTADEINAVAQAMNPHYPHQNLENAGPECVYYIGGVFVTLNINKEEEQWTKPNTQKTDSAISSTTTPQKAIRLNGIRLFERKQKSLLPSCTTAAHRAASFRSRTQSLRKLLCGRMRQSPEMNKEDMS